MKIHLMYYGTLEILFLQVVDQETAAHLVSVALSLVALLIARLEEDIISLILPSILEAPFLRLSVVLQLERSHLHQVIIFHPERIPPFDSLKIMFSFYL